VAASSLQHVWFCDDIHAQDRSYCYILQERRMSVMLTSNILSTRVYVFDVFGIYRVRQ